MKIQKIRIDLSRFTKDTESSLIRNVELLATIIRYIIYFIIPIAGLLSLNFLLYKNQLGLFAISFVLIIIGIPLFAYLMIRLSRFISRYIIAPLLTYPLYRIVDSI
jgi:hypothetical protein